jgi:flagellar biosynthesis protein FliP
MRAAMRTAIGPGLIRRNLLALAWAIAPLAGLIVWLIADPASAQSFSLDLNRAGGSSTSQIIQLFGLLTVLSLAPSILMMVTAFIRIVVVLSFLRTAMGIQQTPPNSVMVSLALFLTAFIMAPTLQEAYTNGIAPLVANEIDEAEAFEQSVKPFHAFMMQHVREPDLILFADIAKIGAIKVPEDTPLQVLVPAFMISELRRGFEIGFLLFLPFLIIDMVVASILMSMGMMMLPPAAVAMPFKIIFFVLVDGWHLISGTLVQSFGTIS